MLVCEYIRTEVSLVKWLKAVPLNWYINRKVGDQLFNSGLHGHFEEIFQGKVNWLLSMGTIKGRYPSRSNQCWEKQERKLRPQPRSSQIQSPWTEPGASNPPNPGSLSGKRAPEESSTKQRWYSHWVPLGWSVWRETCSRQTCVCVWVRVCVCVYTNTQRGLVT